MKYLLQRFVLEPNERLIEVINWAPWWGPCGIEWPVMRIDRAGQRQTIVPVWNWCRIKYLFK